MSIALRRVRERVRFNLNDFDAHGPVYDTIALDQAIAESYLYVSALLPGQKIAVSSGITIAAGGDTFTLSASITQWTGNNGGAEHRGDVRIQLRSNGRFLRRLTLEELDGLREGILPTSPVLGIPSDFALWETKDQVVHGRCYPGALAAEACDMFLSLEASDLRDYVGSGTDDLDDVVLEMSRVGVEAVILHASGCLLGKLAAEKAQGLGLDKSYAPVWIQESRTMIHQERVRRHNLESIGRQERNVA